MTSRDKRSYDVSKKAWHILLLFIQVASFAWLNSKIEKISTEDKFESYGFFFARYYISEV